MNKNCLSASFLLFLGAMGQAQTPDLVSISGNTQTCAGACIQFQANTVVRQTTGYDVVSIPFNPAFSSGNGTQFDLANDDVFINFGLPFNFCFYGNTYGSVAVGSNGVLTFDTVVNGSFCPWEIPAGSIPSASFPVRNAIYGVYQDVDIRGVNYGGDVVNPNIQNVNFYVGGTAPNRYAVINFNQLPSFNCSADLQTSQIVLYETSNIIDVNVTHRGACDGWNTGRGLIGVQNADGTLAVTPPNRNVGNWNADSEAWRFLPNGGSSVIWQWNVNTAAVSNELTDHIIVCPNSDVTINLTGTILLCDGTTTVVQKSVDLSVVALQAGEPSDLSVCTDQEYATFDLTTQTPVILDALDPTENEVVYYTSLADAANYAANFISNPSVFTATDGQVIYARVTSLISNCFDIKSFELNVVPLTVAPDGDSEQDFEAGDTLADLDVVGTNVTWWDAAVGGNELPENTPLVDGTTYYAESTNEAGCSNTGNRMAAQRLAVTVTQVALGTPVLDGTRLVVAPNPAHDRLQIQSRLPISRVQVYNLVGQQVLDAQPNAMQTKLSLVSLASGTYLLKVKVNNQEKTFKILKQ